MKTDDLALLAPYRYDIPGFARDILNIELHPGQVEYCNTVSARGMDGWSAAYHTICLSSGNRAGKTMVLAIIIFHSVLFKTSMRPPNLEDIKSIRRWQRQAYMWFHFAIQQEIAELVYTEIVNFLTGTHVAQKGKGCLLTELMPEVASWERKYNGDYRWIVLADRLGGGQIHFRTTAERGVGTLGRDMHGISFDEAGFEAKLSYIINNVMHLRRLGTGGQLLLVSTPEEGLTEFADYWLMGEPDAPDRHKGRMSVRMSTRDNVGYGISQKTFDELIEGMDQAHVDQNIDGYFIQGRNAYFNAGTVDACFIDGLEERQLVQNLHAYAQGVDPALRHDSTWSLVFDVILDNETGEPWATGVCADQMHGKQTTEGIVTLAAEAHWSYEVDREGMKAHCATAIDATGFGGKMFKEALEKVIPSVRAVEFGGNAQRKRKLLGDLRTMIDSGRLKMPRTGIWLKVRRQLLGYKLDDRAIEQDAVMALAVAVAQMKRVDSDAWKPVTWDWRLSRQPVPSENSWLDTPFRR